MRFLLPLLFLATTLCAAPLNESVLLDAIAQVENSPGIHPGKAGEMGRWQMVPNVVKQVGGYDRRAARKWLRIVIDDLKRYDIEVSPYSVGCVWNAGINNVKRRRIPSSTRDYASRVEATYEVRLPKLPPRFELTPAIK